MNILPFKHRLLHCLVILFCVAGVSASAAEETAKPRLVIIGDSTVKNGRGDGAGGLWGWGQVIGEQFDPERIHIENRALGGRSSRTYLTEGLWQQSLARLRPGDFLLMQFGHNDGGKLFDGNRPRASLKGNDEETETGIVIMTGKEETVHTYGWYLRKYVEDAKSRGATPIVLSLVPRNIWKDGHVIRADNDYGKWAAEAAQQSGAYFVDLNGIIAGRYDAEGEDTVRREYFTSADHTHTTQAGARVNAACVAEGIRNLTDSPLRNYLRDAGNAPSGSYQFYFGTGAVPEGYVRVLPTDVYSPEAGYGFEPAAKLTDDEGCVGDGPFYFSMQLSEGNYRVTATCGNADSGPLTVCAELRRQMLAPLRLPPGELITCECTVNVRRPWLADGSSVRLKDREKTSEAQAWDDKLTLQFDGPRPRLTELTVRPEPNAVTVYLAGDSTVCDQPLAPWNSWGQVLPQFFQPGIAIANHAESGESLSSFLGERRAEKIFNLIRPGDWLFIQFGHNDMKIKKPDALETYRSNLKALVKRARQAGAQPVLVTSMERKAGLNEDTLAGYPQAMREVAQQLQVPLIDLNQMSRTLYKALGRNLDTAFQDGTHHTRYGSYLLARCVVQGIRDSGLPLADQIRNDVPTFDPGNPDSLESFDAQFPSFAQDSHEATGR